MFTFLKKLTGKDKNAGHAPHHGHKADGGCCGGAKKAPEPQKETGGCCGGHGHHHHDHGDHKAH